MGLAHCLRSRVPDDNLLLGRLRAVVQRGLRSDVRHQLRRTSLLELLHRYVPKLHCRICSEWLQYLRSSTSDSATSLHNGLLIAVQHLQHVQFRLLDLLLTGCHANIVRTASLLELQWQLTGGSRSASAAVLVAEPRPSPAANIRFVDTAQRQHERFGSTRARSECERSRSA